MGYQPVEHLGLRAAGWEVGGQGVALAAPRDGWGLVRLLAEGLAVIPCGMEIREQAAAMFLNPKARRALPLVEPPPQDLAKCLWKAITAKRCTWWCQGRFWLEHVQLHPVLGAAVQALKAGAKVAAWAHSHMLQAAARCYAGVLGLEVQAWDPGEGLVVAPQQGADEQVVRAAARAAVKDSLPAGRFGGLAFRP